MSRERGILERVGDALEKVGERIGIVKDDIAPARRSSTFPPPRRSSGGLPGQFPIMRKSSSGSRVGQGPVWTSVPAPASGIRRARPTSQHRVRRSELRQLQTEARSFQHQKVVREPVQMVRRKASKKSKAKSSHKSVKKAKKSKVKRHHKKARRH